MLPYQRATPEKYGATDLRDHQLQEKLRKATDTFNFLRHVTRAILSVRPKCSHKFVSLKESLSGPISRDIAIVSLRYPLSRDTFSAIPAIPQQGAIPPPPVPSFTQTYQCDARFCNISRDTCAISQENKHEQMFAILSLKVSRDMKSIATGPLRGIPCKTCANPPVHDQNIN